MEWGARGENITRSPKIPGRACKIASITEFIYSCFYKNTAVISRISPDLVYNICKLCVILRSREQVYTDSCGIRTLYINTT